MYRQHNVTFGLALRVLQSALRAMSRVWECYMKTLQTDPPCVPSLVYAELTMWVVLAASRALSRKHDCLAYFNLSLKDTRLTNHIREP